ncbi:MAG: peptide chain release factor N(5)-glutamine methyltransferase [Spirochaetota bacterium]
MSPGRPVPAIRDLLAEARGKVEPGDAYVLLEHALRRTRRGEGAPGRGRRTTPGCGAENPGKEFILSHPEHRPSRRQVRAWRAALRRRLSGEPAAYITGRREFYGLSFRVKHTLVPRPETELLVEEVLRLRPESLLEVGTGSGAVAVAVRHRLPSCRVTAIEASRAALRTARRNVRELLGPGEVRLVRARFPRFRGGERFQVVAANPPYVKTGELDGLPPEVRREPRLALDGGVDGLRAYRALAAGTGELLAPGGFLVLEIDPALRLQVEELARAGGFRVRKVARDLAGRERVLVLGAGD